MILHTITINFQSSKLSISKAFVSPLLCSSLHSRVLPPRNESLKINWKSLPFVLSNPLLNLLERCKSLSQLKQIQAHMVLTGLISDGVASSGIIAFCALSESRNLDHCTKILFNTKNLNAYSWNVAIRGFAESERAKEALVLYIRMLRIGSCGPDNYTHPLLFKVCASLGLSYMGHEIVGHVFQLGFDKDAFVRNAMMHMLLSIGQLSLARKVFDESCAKDLVSWNSLINGYVRSGHPKKAISIYEEMMKKQVKPDVVTMIGIISSCAQLENLKLGREFHRYIEESELNLTTSLANALIHMYIRCGDLQAAKTIFDNMTKKTVVSWTTMIDGYAKHGLFDVAWNFFHDMPEKNVVSWNVIMGGFVQAKHSKDALILFHEMQVSNTKPDRVTMVHALSACSQIGALDVGIWIHHLIKKQNLPLDVALGTALVDMYAKCGNITKALQVFHEIPQRNSLTWTAVIGGLAIHGKAHDAISYFSKMIDIGLMPDEITFLGVLSACCHGGLVEEGRKYFAQMKSKFKLSPQLKHYSCMVDLLGRAGFLEEAEELIRSMPIEADAAVWGALFFACRVHGNLWIGRKAASKLLELDSHDSATYVLLANIYREANMFKEACNLWKVMRKKGLEKTPGSSLIEVNGIVYEFIARDKLHPQSQEIYECLIWLTRQLKWFGDDFILGLAVRS